MGMWSDLNKDNFAVLSKHASGSFEVEIVDEFLKPMVHVKKGSKKLAYDLDDLGFFYSDGDNKFYSNESEQSVKASDIVDVAIERFFGDE